MREDKLKGEGRNYKLEIGATGDKPRSIVQEVRTLEFLLNGGLEHIGDHTDIGG
jgi:hypothetical protein